MMNILGPLSNLFPLFHWILIWAAALKFIREPHAEWLLLLLAVIYLLPPGLFRLYSLKYPARSGRWTLDPDVRNDWWIYYQLQMVYANVPAFESILRAIPFAYSAWLRLWGSRIGKRVYWTPNVQILDRHMMRIGDDVVFGHLAICSAHLVTKRRDGRLALILRPIEIGDGCLIGGEARIGPGVRVPPNTLVPYRAEYRFHYAED
jgi:hypothetical protein